LDLAIAQFEFLLADNLNLNSSVDFACTRQVNTLEIKFWWAKNHFIFSLFQK